MARKYVDCREMPSQANCTIAIAAEKEDELLEAAVMHAVTVHQERDTPELRKEIKAHFKQGSPPP